MSLPRHTLIAYFDDGYVLRRPWRVRRSAMNFSDGPATDEQLALWASSQIVRVERAVIVRPDIRSYAPHWRVVATYLRSTQPTATQERLIERILAKPDVIFSKCSPQPNGDIVIERWGANNHKLASTIVFRHPTIRELIFSED